MGDFNTRRAFCRGILNKLRWTLNVRGGIVNNIVIGPYYFGHPLNPVECLTKYAKNVQNFFVAVCQNPSHN